MFTSASVHVVCFLSLDSEDETSSHTLGMTPSEEDSSYEEEIKVEEWRRGEGTRTHAHTHRLTQWNLCLTLD